MENLSKSLELVCGSSETLIFQSVVLHVVKKFKGGCLKFKIQSLIIEHIGNITYYYTIL